MAVADHALDGEPVGHLAPEQQRRFDGPVIGAETKRRVARRQRRARLKGDDASIFGDKGEMSLLNWNEPTISGNGVYRGKKTPLGSASNVQPVPRTEHFLDWFQCLRTRNTPHAAIDAGYQHGVAVIMAQLAWETGRRQVYDQVGREIREG